MGARGSDSLAAQRAEADALRRAETASRARDRVVSRLAVAEAKVREAQRALARRRAWAALRFCWASTKVNSDEKSAGEAKAPTCAELHIERAADIPHLLAVANRCWTFVP